MRTLLALFVCSLLLAAACGDTIDASGPATTEPGDGRDSTTIATVPPSSPDDPDLTYLPSPCPDDVAPMIDSLFLVEQQFEGCWRTEQSERAAAAGLAPWYFLTVGVQDVGDGPAPMGFIGTVDTAAGIALDPSVADGGGLAADANQIVLVDASSNAALTTTWLDARADNGAVARVQVADGWAAMPPFIERGQWAEVTGYDASLQPLPSTSATVGRGSEDAEGSGDNNAAGEPGTGGDGVGNGQAPGPFVVDIAGTEVHGFAAGEPAPDLRAFVYYLFLHGAAFSSQTWVDNGVLDAAARPITLSFAVDLPGFGATDQVDLAGDQYVARVMADLELPPEQTVVIAPSMAGGYLLPALRNGSLDGLAGVVLVAPVDGPAFVAAGDPVEVPALIVWGDGDGADPQGSAQALAAGFTTSKVVVIDNAGHDAYNQQPDAFVAALHDFTTTLPPCLDSRCFIDS